MTFLFLIMVSGCGFGAPAALLGTRGVSGRVPVAAAVVGAAAGLAPGDEAVRHLILHVRSGSKMNPDGEAAMRPVRRRGGRK